MNQREPIPEETARRIYKILERHGGAHHDGEVDFVRAATEGITEYRFIGTLGFGGKFWNNAGRWYVSCYSEDETPDRKARITAANLELARLRPTSKDCRALTGKED
jgi:hypothetical protein